MIRSLLLVLFGGCAALVRAATPEVPRQAPEFVIQFPGGQEKLLSSYRGKVVAVEFLYTTCPHCQHASTVFSKMFAEYGPKGFQPIGVAFNDMSHMLVPDFIKNFGVSYPIGFSQRDPVLNFLGVTNLERFVVPQIVWIDRKGMIRSQTPAGGDEKLLTEESWRAMLDTLLKEPASASHRTAAPVRRVAKKTAS